ncbi:MAG: TIGR04255 family protein [Methylococcales bacterium]|nr:TIGR04255 family protein [Methylococcales bacterium]
MAKPLHLDNAPITEALVDIQVEQQQGLTFDGLQEAFNKLDFGYYFKNQISQGTFGFRLTSDGQEPQTTAEAVQIGLRLHSSDEQYVAQCRLTGFTLSRLPPYETWNALIKEAKRIWSVYSDRTAPVRVTRVATRFINNLQLPLDYGASFQTYLQKFADVPEEAPQALSSFFQQFQLVDTSSNARVNLTLAMESIRSGEPAPVILDVDAFTFTTLDPEDEKLWAILENLRDLKNRCFFGSLTDQAVELYK